MPAPLPSVGPSQRAARRAAVTSTAQTLNSGMPETGSVASVVSRLTLSVPAQWNGTNTVSGRIESVTLRRARRASPAPWSSRTRSPSATPSRAASSGCTSAKAPGTAPARAGTRRVWAPDW